MFVKLFNFENLAKIKENAEPVEFLEKINSRQEKVNSPSAFVNLPKCEE